MKKKLVAILFISAAFVAVFGLHWSVRDGATGAAQTGVAIQFPATALASCGCPGFSCNGQYYSACSCISDTGSCQCGGCFSSGYGYPVATRNMCSC